MNLKTITFKDLQKMYGEEYQDLNDIKKDYCIFFHSTLKEAICDLLDENTCVLNDIVKGDFYKYLQSHIVKFGNGYLINWNEKF